MRGVGCQIPARGWWFSGRGRLVFWVGLAVRSRRRRMVWWMVGDAWVGDRWSPLVSDAWRTVVTPDAGQWLPVRGRERASVRGGGEGRWCRGSRVS